MAQCVEHIKDGWGSLDPDLHGNLIGDCCILCDRPISEEDENDDSICPVCSGRYFDE